MRSEFEKLPQIESHLHNVVFDEGSNEYLAKKMGHLPFEFSEWFLNGSWLIYQHQQSKVDELQKRVDDLEKSQNRLEILAEEAECVSMCLDDHGVPKCDDQGKYFSLWGRVCRFKKSNTISEDDLELIYWEFDSERRKNGEERLRFKEALRGLEQALKGGGE